MPDERISFNDFCEHPFIYGMPSIKPSLNLSDLECLTEDIEELTKEEALDFSETVILIAEKVEYPFLLHMRACMLLKPYLYDKVCVEFFQKNFKEASEHKNKND